MKRLGMIVATLLLVVTVGFAQSQNGKKSVKIEQLTMCLELRPHQMEEVYKINKYFAIQLGGAVNTENLFHNSNPERAQNALLGNLKLMKKVLTPEQYNKYVTLIDNTRVNQEVSITNPHLEKLLAEK